MENDITMQILGCDTVHVKDNLIFSDEPRDISSTGLGDYQHQQSVKKIILIACFTHNWKTTS